MNERMIRIAVIGGAGKMGRWLARFLKKDDREVVLADRDEAGLRQAGQELGVSIIEDNRAAVAGADYVLVAVPADSLESVMREIGDRITAGQAVIDVTSSKLVPVEIMHRYIRKGTVLGGHPLFGPGAGDITNKNFVLTPTGAAELELAEKVKGYLEARGARVSLMSPAEHDEMMSLVLGLSHFIALVSADTLLDSGNLRPMETAGSSTYKVLLTLIESVLSEDPDLYAAIQTDLPQVTQFEKLFREKTGRWAELVAAGDRAGFARRMKALKDRLAAVAPDFEKSYEKMYRIVEGL
jgi:prephenate dehydrogenase